MLDIFYEIYTFILMFFKSGKLKEAAKGPEYFCVLLDAMCYIYL